MTTPLLLPVLIAAGAVALGLLPPLLRRSPASKGRVAAGAVAALVVVAAGFGGLAYLGSDNRDLAERIALHESDPQAAMRGFARELRERIRNDGEAADAQSYFRLGRALSGAGDREEAIAAYAEANHRSDDDNPDFLVAEAEARLNDRQRSAESHGIAERRIEEALAVAPRHSAANFYAGALALGAGNEAEALPHLRVVLESDLLEGAARQRLAQRIESIDAKQGSEQPGADSEANVPSLRVTVHPADDGAPPEGGTLFVFLRRPDGPPMPVAARRLDAPQWPVTVHLRDSDRLSGGPSLFSYDALVVAARWSASGDALSDRDGPQAQQRIDPEADRELELQLSGTAPD